MTRQGRKEGTGANRTSRLLPWTPRGVEVLALEADKLGEGRI